jgi:hypothetical protein
MVPIGSKVSAMTAKSAIPLQSLRVGERSKQDASRETYAGEFGRESRRSAVQKDQFVCGMYQ